MRPADGDADLLGQLATQTCPGCGQTGLPVTVSGAGDNRYLGWSCTRCDVNGIFGLYPRSGAARAGAQPGRGAPGLAARDTTSQRLVRR